MPKLTSTSLIWYDDQTYGTIVTEGGSADHWCCIKEPHSIPSTVFEQAHRGYAKVRDTERTIHLYLSPCVLPDRRYIPGAVYNWFCRKYRGYTIEQHGVLGYG